MRTPKTLATSLLTLSAAALLALSAAGAATASPAPAKAPVSASDVASHTVTETGAADYWTAERMRSAVPGDVLADKAMKRSGKAAAAGGPAETGAPSKVEAAAPEAAIPDAPDQGQCERDPRPAHRQGLLHPRRDQLRLLRQLGLLRQQEHGLHGRALRE